MAKRKNHYEGKSAADIVKGVSGSIGRITERTLKDAVSKLSAAMNSRLTRLGKSAPESPAYQEAMSSGGKFGTKGKGLEGLKQEFLRIKDFFKNPTSTVTGYKKEIAQAESFARMRGIGNPVPPPAPSPGTFPGWTEEVGAAFREIFPESAGIPTFTFKSEADRLKEAGWVYDESSDTWSHKDYGSGWIPYEGAGGGLYDPVTGELVANKEVTYHDFDATKDNRLYGKGTETGFIWGLVDAISKVDPRFNRIEYTDPMDSPRMRLFMAIDDARVENPDIHSFEEARDWAVQHLDEIYHNDSKFVENAKSHNFSIFDTEYHEDD